MRPLLSHTVQESLTASCLGTGFSTQAADAFSRKQQNLKTFHTLGLDKPEIVLSRFKPKGFKYFPCVNWENGKELACIVWKSGLFQLIFQTLS